MGTMEQESKKCSKKTRISKMIREHNSIWFQSLTTNIAYGFGARARDLRYKIWCSRNMRNSTTSKNHTFCLLVHYSPSARNKQLKPIYSFSNYKNLTVEEQPRLYSSPTRVNPFQRLFFHKDLHASPNKLDLTVTPCLVTQDFAFLCTDLVCKREVQNTRHFQILSTKGYIFFTK